MTATPLRLTMRLNLPRLYSLIELKDWVTLHQPSEIEMTRDQVEWYTKLVRQRTFDRPLKFLSIPITQL